MATKKIEEIKTHPLFEGLFTINDDLLARIEQNMREENYDDSQPIILGTWPGQDYPVCIDGHTRLKAATNVGMKEVLVSSYTFETEEAAFAYAVHLQTNRRNLSDGDLIHFIERLHEPKPRGGDRKSEDSKSTPQSCGNENGRSAGAKRTAELLNIKPRKVEKALTVINKGLPEIKEAVLKNEISINKAYKETQKQRKQLETALSKENSDDMAIDDSRESEQGGKDSKPSGKAPVSIPLDLVGALHELGGSVDDHAAEAIKRYLESFQEQHEESSPESGEQNDDEDKDLNEQDKGQHADGGVEDQNDDEDEEEYFDPNNYE